MDNTLFNDKTFKEREMPWCDLYEIIYVEMVNDVLLLNEKFNLIDTPLQGQLPNRVIEAFKMHTKYKNRSIFKDQGHDGWN